MDLPAGETKDRCRASDGKNAVARGKPFRVFERMALYSAIHTSRAPFLFLLSLAALLAACQTTPKDEDWDVPLTLKTFPKAYADYVLEIADTNKDESITLVEWTNAGGDKRSFLLVDQNKDDVVTRTELVRISSNGKFLDMTRRYADFNKDNRLTPREFRSSAGVRVLRFEF